MPNIAGLLHAFIDAPFHSIFKGTTKVLGRTAKYTRNAVAYSSDMLSRSTPSASRISAQALREQRELALGKVNDHRKFTKQVMRNYATPEFAKAADDAQKVRIGQLKAAARGQGVHSMSNVEFERLLTETQRANHANVVPGLNASAANVRPNGGIQQHLIPEGQPLVDLSTKKHYAAEEAIANYRAHVPGGIPPFMPPGGAPAA